MAYLGQSNSLYDPTRVTPTTVQTFNGDGVTTQFTLQYSILQSIDIEVLVENVVQQPDYAYSAVGNVITFTTAPPPGTNNIYVRFGKVTGLTGTVPDGSITSSKLANNIRLLATDMYTGNGVATQYTLSDTPADANSLIVSVNGVAQAAPTNYTVSGSTITFTSAPDAGANVVIRNVGFRTTQTLYAFPSGTQMVQPVITGGSANNISITNSTANNLTLNNATITNSTANNLTLNNATINGGTANGILYVNSSNTVTSGTGLVFNGTNVGIGTTTPAAKLDIAGGLKLSTSQWLTFGSDNTFYSDASYGLVVKAPATSNFIAFRSSDDTERMRIDSSGRVTLPYNPGFLARMSSTTGFTSSQVIKWNQLQYNIGSCYNSSTGRFTAPVAGVYFFSTSGRNNNGSYGFTDIRTSSGILLARNELPTNLPNYIQQEVSGVVYLNANDYVYCDYTQVSGSGTGMTCDDQYYAHFCGQLIG